MKSRLAIRFATLLGIVGMSMALGISANATAPNDDGIHKWWVCKYVGKPAVDERLKGGKNPIAVDDASISGSGWLADAQGQSYAISRVVPGENAPPVTRCGRIES